MNQACTNCSQNFVITDDEKQFCTDVAPRIGEKTFPIPLPIQCPDCRMQNRLQFRNFFYYYHRTCDLSGKQIISMYKDDSAFPVYDLHEWWSDKWDGLEYGIDPSTEKPVFEQLAILHSTVPRMNIFNTQCENTDYSNVSLKSRNCYLVGGCVHNEDCSYGHIVWHSKDCFDNLYIYKCERCYECIDCFECYNLAYSRACENCSDSRFLVHCTGCKDCFGCVGLKRQQYVLFNEQLTEQEYKKRMEEFQSGSHHMVEVALQKLATLIGKETVKYIHGVANEEVSGDYLYNCKGVQESYDVKNGEDCRYIATAETPLHTYDGNYLGASTEWSYNILTSYNHGILMCHCTMNCSDMIYCDSCYNSKNCFGCFGLKGKQYCIFNKQYTKEEYESIVSSLIERMQSTGEWGLFFPVQLSSFAYNETMAYEYFPLTKEEVVAKGWTWYDDEQQENYMGPDSTVPDDIADVDDSICEKILRCRASEKPYKIIPQELSFLQEMQLPLPRKHFLERHKLRMSQRNPRKLWSRTCQKCDKEIQTSYSPERPETVYCEECFLHTTYS